jgi:RecA/RadA recombinase
MLLTFGKKSLVYKKLDYFFKQLNNIMAKKKKTEDEFEENSNSGNTNSDSLEETGTKKNVLSKKFGKLGDYKAKINFKDVKYKPQEWINMSPAFKEVTKLPGIPTGHVIMNYGKSDTGKSTMALEAAANAQKQGILPVFIITENKFSFERGETMGINFDEAIVHNGVSTIEEGCKYMKEILDSQESGDLPYDVLFIWDSIGGTPSEKELGKKEDGESGGGMMVTARVLREEITRYLGPRINATRNESYPYTSTVIFVNQAYTAPPKMPGGPPSLEPYGGDGIIYVATLVFRTGGIMGRSSKVTATKNKEELSFALKTDLVVFKNHITNVSTSKGKIICTDHGFIVDSKESIDAYKKEFADGWDLKYDDYWDLREDKDK